VASEVEQSLTAWTVRLAIGCYAVRAWHDWRLRKSVTTSQRERAIVLWVWTLGCVLYLVHVYCAFAFFHDFSHSNAYQHTAEQTAGVTGLHWGGGIFVNYLFTLFWIGDVVYCWMGQQKKVRGKPIYLWVLHTIFVFMIVNATVVFGPPFWTWVAIAVICFVLILVLYRRQSVL
jgi:hypothetical protein